MLKTHGGYYKNYLLLHLLKYLRRLNHTHKFSQHSPSYLRAGLDLLVNNNEENKVLGIKLKLPLLIVWLCFNLNAYAEERVALVVGVSAYQSIAPLANPVSDAKLIAGKLSELGFAVTLSTDATLAELKKSVSNFGRQLRAGGEDTVGLFYYAGHGVQSYGSNYLLPADTNLTDAADLDLVAVEANSILRQMFSAKNKANVVILDACRNNPFEQIPEFGDNGLAEMKAPTGTFLSYATAPGEVAIDGNTSNSPFTAALAEEMLVPGAPIEQVFKQVRVKVLARSSGTQTPWDTSSLTSQFYFNPPVQLSGKEQAEKQMWDSAKFSRDMLQVMLFLRSHPGSEYEKEARELLTEIVTGTSPSETEEQESEQVAAREIATTTNDESANREKELIDQAQVTKNKAGYQAYLAEFPEGTYAELAKYEFSAIEAKEAELKKATEDVTSEENSEALENELIENAQKSGDIASYEAYLSAFPNGVYAELAQFEISVLQEKLAAQAETEAKTTNNAQSVEESTASSGASGAVTSVVFESLIAVGPEGVVGKNIEHIIEGSPTFAPIEGLPESYWKNETCSNCHQWTRDALCTQANSYLKENGAEALKKQHPLGGAFKQHLRDWASNDCQ